MASWKKKTPLLQIGRRSGKNVIPGKAIRTEEDGTDVFDDYWTDSDNDTDDFDSPKINNLEKIGRRTRLNVNSERGIRLQEDGTEMYDDYWAEDSKLTDNSNLIHQTSGKTNITNRNSIANFSNPIERTVHNKACNTSIHLSGRKKNRHSGNVPRNSNLSPEYVENELHSNRKKIAEQTVNTPEKSVQGEGMVNRSLRSSPRKSVQNNTFNTSRSIIAKTGNQLIEGVTSNTESYSETIEQDSRTSLMNERTKQTTNEPLPLSSKKIVQNKSHNMSLSLSSPTKKPLQNEATRNKSATIKRKNQVIDDSESDIGEETENMEDNRKTSTKHGKSVELKSGRLPFSPRNSVPNQAINTSTIIKKKKKVTEDISEDSDVESINLEQNLTTTRSERVKESVSRSLRFSPKQSVVNKTLDKSAGEKKTFLSLSPKKPLQNEATQNKSTTIKRKWKNQIIEESESDTGTETENMEGNQRTSTKDRKSGPLLSSLRNSVSNQAINTSTIVRKKKVTEDISEDSDVEQIVQNLTPTRSERVEESVIRSLRFSPTKSVGNKTLDKAAGEKKISLNLSPKKPLQNKSTTIRTKWENQVIEDSESDTGTETENMEGNRSTSTKYGKSGPLRFSHRNSDPNQVINTSTIVRKKKKVAEDISEDSDVEPINLDQNLTPTRSDRVERPSIRSLRSSPRISGHNKTLDKAAEKEMSQNLSPKKPLQNETTQNKSATIRRKWKNQTIEDRDNNTGAETENMEGIGKTSAKHGKSVGLNSRPLRFSPKNSVPNQVINTSTIVRKKKKVAEDFLEDSDVEPINLEHNLTTTRSERVEESVSRSLRFSPKKSVDNKTLDKAAGEKKMSLSLSPKKTLQNEASQNNKSATVRRKWKNQLFEDSESDTGTEPENMENNGRTSNGKSVGLKSGSLHFSPMSNVPNLVINTTAIVRKRNKLIEDSSEGSDAEPINIEQNNTSTRGEIVEELAIRSLRSSPKKPLRNKTLGKNRGKKRISKVIDDASDSDIYPENVEQNDSSRSKRAETFNESQGFSLRKSPQNKALSTSRSTRKRNKLIENPTADNDVELNNAEEIGMAISEGVDVATNRIPHTPPRKSPKIKKTAKPTQKKRKNKEIEEIPSDTEGFAQANEPNAGNALLDKESKKKKQNVVDEDSPSDQLRRSNRNRIKPLATWRNERQKFVYRFGTGEVVSLGIEAGTTEDDFLKRRLERLELNKKRKKKLKPFRKAGNYSKIPQTSVLDHKTGEKVQVHLHRPFDLIEWTAVKSKHSAKIPYHITKSFTSEKISFGFLEISVAEEKNSQYSPTDNLHFVVLKGHVEATIRKTVYEFVKNDSFVVPYKEAYSIRNLGSTNALLSFCTFKIPFFSYQSDEDVD